MTRMIQEIVDRAVATATKAALSGHPVARIIWSPSVHATDDPIGTFTIVPYTEKSATKTPPWES